MKQKIILTQNPLQACVCGIGSTEKKVKKRIKYICFLLQRPSICSKIMLNMELSSFHLGVDQYWY